MNITVIGAGNSGFTAALDLMARPSVNILVYTRKPEKASALRLRGLEAGGLLSGRYEIPITADLDEAASFADILIVNTWANAHKEVFSRLKGRLKKDQILLILNGNWGACEARQILGEEAGAKNVRIAETASQIYLGQLTYDEPVTSAASGDTGCVSALPTGIRVNAIKKHVTLAALKKEETADVMESLRDILPAMTAADSVLATSLSSANPIIHAPLSLFHLSQIESAESFCFLSSTSQSVLDYVDRMDRERMTVARALGVSAVPALEEMNRFWGKDYADLHDIFANNPAYNRLNGPRSLKHRFITEDIPFGIQPVSDLAELTGTEVPYTNALLQMYRLSLPGIFEGNRVTFKKEEVEAL